MSYLLLLLLLLGTCNALAQTPMILALNPPPKSAFARHGMFGISFGGTFGTPIVVADNPSQAAQHAAVFLQQVVQRSMGFSPPMIHASEFRGDRAILLGEPDTWPALADSLRLVMPPGELRPGAGGYILDISSAHILVAGIDPDGTFSAVATLAQLLIPGDATAFVQAAHIYDYPDYPVRWVFSQHNLRGNSAITTLHTIMALLKLNGFQQNDFKYSILSSQPAHYFDSVNAFRTICDERNIQIIPSVASIGYSTGHLWHDPNLAEGVETIQRYVVEADTGRLLLDPRVTLPNGNFEQVDSNNEFTGWSYYDGPNQRAFADHSVVHSGATSARCTDFNVGNTSGNCRFNRKVDCLPQTYYMMSAWLRTENLDVDEVRLLAIGQNDNGKSRALTYTAFSIPATLTNWTRVEVTFNSLEFNQLQLYAGVWGGRTGTIWWDDFEIHEAGLTNILRRGGTPLHVRNATTGTLYEEGKDFAPISDTVMLAANGSYGPYHSPPTLRRLTTGAIANGDILTVSFFHPLTTVADTRGIGQNMVCISEPVLYNILTDQVRRIDSLYQPQQFMFGHDEIRLMNRDSACLRRGLTPADLLADNVSRCIDIVESRRAGAGSLVWSDMFDSLHNAYDNYYLVNGDLSGIWEKIPSQVGIMNWNYGSRSQSLKMFARLGHNQVASVYYDTRNAANLRNWRLAMEGVPGVIGMMYTTWNSDYTWLKPFAYYVWGAGPYIVHQPLDSNALPVAASDSVRIEATILPDPYDVADSIMSAIAHIKIAGVTPVTEDVQLVRQQGNEFVGYAHMLDALDGEITYNVSAHNTHGLIRTTPTYRYFRKTSDANGLHQYPTLQSPSIALMILPNPMRTAATIRFRLPAAGNWQMEIVDMLGRTVFVMDGTAVVSMEQIVRFDGIGLPAGAYRCRVQRAGEAVSAMVFIVH